MTDLAAPERVINGVRYMRMYRIYDAKHQVWLKERGTGVTTDITLAGRFGPSFAFQMCGLLQKDPQNPQYLMQPLPMPDEPHYKEVFGL